MMPAGIRDKLISVREKVAIPPMIYKTIERVPVKRVAVVPRNTSFGHPWFERNRMRGGPPIPTPAVIKPLMNPTPMDDAASLLIGI